MSIPEESPTLVPEESSASLPEESLTESLTLVPEAEVTELTTEIVQNCGLGQDEDVQKAKAALQEASTGGVSKEVVKGLQEVNKALKENKHNLTSDDPYNVAVGALALTGAVMAACPGPVAAVGVAFCFTATIMGFFQKSESEGLSIAKVVDTVVVKALSDYKDMDLKDKATTVMHKLEGYTAFLNGLTSVTAQDKGMLANMGMSIIFANEALVPLMHQFENEDPERAASYIVHYATVAMATHFFQAQLCQVLGAAGMENVQSAVKSHMDQMWKTHREALLPFSRPTPKNKRAYARLHELKNGQRKFLAAFMSKAECPFEGRLVVFENKIRPHNNRLGASPPSSEYNTLRDEFWRALVDRSATLQLNRYPERFRIFGPDENCTICNVSTGTFIVFRPGPYWQRVWRCDEPPDQQAWAISGGTIFNKKHKQYLHADEHGRVFCENEVKAGGSWTMEEKGFYETEGTPCLQQ